RGGSSYDGVMDRPFQFSTKSMLVAVTWSAVWLWCWHWLKHLHRAEPTDPHPLLVAISAIACWSILAGSPFAAVGAAASNLKVGMLIGAFVVLFSFGFLFIVGGVFSAVN